MKKTIITTMPDKSGEFLKACECFYNLNINILRVSYNKSVDTNTMFIEVDGEEENLNKLTLEFER